MGCETGNCPSCKIKVGAMPIKIGQFTVSDYIQPYHLFIVYYDTTKTILYRGGPARGGKYAKVVREGLAQQYEAPTSEYADIDWPFDNLVTNRMEGLTDNYDFEQWTSNGSQPRQMVTIAEGADYCGLDEVFTRETRRIGMLGRTYNAVDIDRTDNSNATVYTILQEMDLPLKKPPVHAPGWGTNLHTETTVVEDIANLPGQTAEGVKKALEPVRREINWFNGLSSLDQIRVLERILGGP